MGNQRETGNEIEVDIKGVTGLRSLSIQMGEHIKLEKRKFSSKVFRYHKQPKQLQ